MSVVKTLRNRAASITAERAATLATMKQITNTAQTAGRARLTVEEDARFAIAQTQIDLLDADADDVTARLVEAEMVEARAARAAVGAASRWPVSDGGSQRGTSEVRGAALDHLQRRHSFPGTSDATIERAIDAIESDPTDKIAAIARSTADPSYLSAFTKAVRDPNHGPMTWTDDERAAFARVSDIQRAMAVGSNPSGGYMVPFTLDPAITITGGGSVNPMRQIASKRLTATSSWHGVTAGQISASWDAESSAVSDDSPTLAQPTLNLTTGRAFIPASFEMFDDVADLAAEISMLLADGKNVLESTAFATGTGTGQPKGVITATNAVVGSRVAASTAATFKLDDIYKLQNALPARHSANASWLMALPTINMTRRFGEGTTGSNSAFWTDLGQGQPPQLLGRALNEYSALSSTVAATQIIAAYGDFSKYRIVDHVGETRLEYVPHLLDSVTGRPTGQRGWLLWWRTAADMLDPDAARVLVL